MKLIKGNFRQRNRSLFMVAGLVAALVMASGAFAATGPKYVFYFIGDGLGLPQRSAAEAFTGERLKVDALPAQGITTTFAADRFITGSAAAATALGSGQKTNIGMIGMAPDMAPVKSVADIAKEQGRKVGVVSSVSIDHATPAAFYAHVKSRDMYHEIDHALANSGFDFFGGGGLKDPAGKRVIKAAAKAKLEELKAKKKEALTKQDAAALERVAKAEKSEKKDAFFEILTDKEKAALVKGDAFEAAAKNGYKVVKDKASFEKLTPADGKVIAINDWLQDSDALPYQIDTRPEDISLEQFTGKAIEMLDNPEGFFLMVEGGKIDWACHANDAKSAIDDTLAFDAAVGKALEFAKKHPDDTLIVVTGDHECGGLTLGFAGTKYESNFDILKPQNVSFQKFTDEVVKPFIKTCGGKCSFDDMKPLITKNFGIKFTAYDEKDPMTLKTFQVEDLEKAFDLTKAGDKAERNHLTKLLYDSYDPLTTAITHVLNNNSGMAWTSFKHTAVPVSTSAGGVGAEAFGGYYDNTDVAKKIMSAMGVEPKIYKISKAESANAVLAAN